jgi:hypothetical protein
MGLGRGVRPFPSAVVLNYYRSATHFAVLCKSIVKIPITGENLSSMNTEVTVASISLIVALIPLAGYLINAVKPAKADYERWLKITDILKDEDALYFQEFVVECIDMGKVSVLKHFEDFIKNSIHKPIFLHHELNYNIDLLVLKSGCLLDNLGEFTSPNIQNPRVNSINKYYNHGGPLNRENSIRLCEEKQLILESARAFLDAYNNFKYLGNRVFENGTRK